MYYYIPLLLWGAGRLLLKEIGRRSQAASASDTDDTAPGTTPAQNQRRAEEASLYGDQVVNLAVGLLAKLAKSDGVVSKQEIHVVESIFAELGFVGESRPSAIALFQAAKDGPLLYLDLVEAFARASRGNDPSVRSDLIYLLLRLAHAESEVLSYQAEHLIQAACTVLGPDYQEHLDAFRAWRQACDATLQADADQVKRAYETLGCEAADSDESLRQRYRQLVRDFHPDTIAGKGLSAEFVRFAEEKFKQIQEAYELLVEQRR